MRGVPVRVSLCLAGELAQRVACCREPPHRFSCFACHVAPHGESIAFGYGRCTDRPARSVVLPAVAALHNLFWISVINDVHSHIWHACFGSHCAAFWRRCMLDTLTEYACAPSCLHSCAGSLLPSWQHALEMSVQASPRLRALTPYCQVAATYDAHQAHSTHCAPR